MNLLRNFLKSVFLVSCGVVIVVSLQMCPGFVVFKRCSPWTPLSNDPGAVSGFLSALAQFAAIPVTLALGIIVLVIQLQAGSLTTRAGALVFNSPQFLFTVTLLIEAPFYCILLLGVIKSSEPTISPLVQALAFAALVPVVLTFIFLFRFTNLWFRAVSPASFTGLAFSQAVQGLHYKNRDSVALAVRGLGESIANLSMSADYAGLRLCANQIGMLLEGYIREFKAKMPERFFYYDWPQRTHSPAWVEVEACDSIRDASDTLMLRGGPEGTIIYLTERLTAFGQAAMDVGDLGAVEVLANTYVGIGTTEKTFMAARNYNPAPMYECANLILANAGDENKAESVELLAAAFFFIFTYVHHYTSGNIFTSSAHETFASKLKDQGIDFSKVAKLSREKFGLWDARFADPDREQQRALKKIQSLR